MDNNFIAMGVIIGLINGIKLAQSDRKSFFYFLLSLVIGVVFGYFGFFGLSVDAGLMVALASSGLYKLSQNVGG